MSERLAYPELACQVKCSSRSRNGVLAVLYQLYIDLGVDAMASRRVSQYSALKEREPQSYLFLLFEVFSDNHLSFWPFIIDVFLELKGQDILSLLNFLAVGDELRLSQSHPVICTWSVRRNIFLYFSLHVKVISLLNIVGYTTSNIMILYYPAKLKIGQHQNISISLSCSNYSCSSAFFLHSSSTNRYLDYRLTIRLYHQKSEREESASSKRRTRSRLSCGRMLRHSCFDRCSSPTKFVYSSTFSPSSACLEKRILEFLEILAISPASSSSSLMVLSSCCTMSLVLSSTSSYLAQLTMFWRQRVKPASRACEVKSSTRCLMRLYSSSMPCRNLEVLSRMACSSPSEASMVSFTAFSCPIKPTKLSALELGERQSLLLFSASYSGTSVLSRKPLLLSTFSSTALFWTSFTYGSFCSSATSTRCRMKLLCCGFSDRASTFSSALMRKLSSLFSMPLPVFSNIQFRFALLPYLSRLSVSSPCPMSTSSWLLLKPQLNRSNCELQFLDSSSGRTGFCLLREKRESEGLRGLGLRVEVISLVGVRKFTTLSFSLLICQD